MQTRCPVKMQRLSGRPRSSGFSASGKLWGLKVGTTTTIHAYSQCEDGVYSDLREVTRITLNPVWSVFPKDALECGAGDDDPAGPPEKGSLCPWKCMRPFVISDWEEDFVRLNSHKDGAFWCELSGNMLPRPRFVG